MLDFSYNQQDWCLVRIDSEAQISCREADLGMARVALSVQTFKSSFCKAPLYAHQLLAQYAGAIIDLKRPLMDSDDLLIAHSYNQNSAKMIEQSSVHLAIDPLPNEIFVAIVLEAIHMCHPSGRCGSWTWTTLTKVSRRWYNILLDESRLWSHINWNTMPIALTVLSEKPLREIDIYLDPFPCTPPLALQTWQRVTRLAEDKSIQIRSLVVKLDRESMKNLLPHLPNHPLPRLEELELVVIDGHDFSSSLDFVPDLPSDHPPLYSLKLEVIGIPLESTIFNGLRKLELIWLALPQPAMDSFLDVLDRCTELEILVLDSSPPLLVDAVDCPNRYRTVELSHLQRLRVVDDRLEQIAHLLLHISLPPNAAIELDWVVEDDWDWSYFLEGLPALSSALQVLGVIEWLDVKFMGGSPDDYRDAYIKAGRGTPDLQPPSILISLESGVEKRNGVRSEIVMLSFPLLFSNSTQLRHLEVTCTNEFPSLEIWADTLPAFTHITALNLTTISDEIENLGPTDEELRTFFASPQVAILCPRLSTVTISSYDFSSL